MKAAVAIAAPLLLLGLDALPARGQACPTNHFSVGGSFDFYEEFPTAPIWGTGLNRYDLIQGTFGAAIVPIPSKSGVGLSLNVQDRYRIVGPASGSPLPVVVRLHATGVAGGGLREIPAFPFPICLGSQATVRLSSEATFDEVLVRSVSSPACGSRAIDEDLAILLSKLPGEEFLVGVSFSLSSGPEMSVSTAATITFEVPAGYSIASCQGYAGQVVPATVASWGRLKNVYR